jgi:hypothetical protein
MTLQPRRSRSSTTLTFLVGLALVAQARTARARDPWPPATAPGAGIGIGTDPSDNTPVRPAAPKPAPEAPAAKPAPETPVPKPAPETPAPQPAPEPEAATVEEDRPQAAPATPAADAETVVAHAPAAPSDAVVGFKDDQAFLRTRNDLFVLLPVARLDLDGHALETATPNVSEQTTEIGLARLDLAGWVAERVFFDFSADFAHGPSARHTDEILGVAPWGDRLLLQAGQFDLPFTLENRTPDRYLDAIERGAAIRAFAVPGNKDQGVMLHGTDAGRRYYFSAGAFNGEGPDVSGASGRVDGVARAWIAPFAYGDPEPLGGVHVGGSAWIGQRVHGPAFAWQTTTTGFSFFDSSLWSSSAPTGALSLREDGQLRAVALELDAPYRNKAGLRWEWIAKHQDLAVFQSVSIGQPLRRGGFGLSGWATYVELWGWVLGDNRLLGAQAEPGLGLPLRLRDLGWPHTKMGLMLVGRVDHVQEDLTAGADTMTAGVSAASMGHTSFTALTLSASFWYTRRVRLATDYVLNKLDGNTPYVNGLESHTVQEFLLRLALAI